jgi:DNA processing protein
VECIYLDTPEFPPLLREIPNPPDCLWARGDRSLFAATAVAIVGARAATRDGIEIAYQIAADLSRAGVVVVSGLARGVDAAAHLGALDADGKTIAVLGTGIDRAYPAEHKDLHERIATKGLLLTEFPPGSPPDLFHFPQRNRIISGLSKAVVVVEAREKSGSLITARLAGDQGRDVLVVPGPIRSGQNRGGHALLRDGAKLVESAVDILQELGLDSISFHPSGAGETGRDQSEPVEFTVDDVAAQLRVTPGEALARLLEWELTGEIQRIGLGRFVRSRSKV